MQIMHVSSMICPIVLACSVAQRTQVVTHEHLHNLNLSPLGFRSKLVFVRSRDTLDWKMILMLTFSFFPCVSIVRKDLEVVKHTSYNSTQEMFLAQVGIQNSFSEDQEGSQVPFFVSRQLASGYPAVIVNFCVRVGASRHLICLHQAKPAILRFHLG